MSIGGDEDRERKIFQDRMSSDVQPPPPPGEEPSYMKCNESAMVSHNINSVTSQRWLVTIQMHERIVLC